MSCSARIFRGRLVTGLQSTVEYEAGGKTLGQNLWSLKYLKREPRSRIQY